MPEAVFQRHLVGRGMSGRGVRYRTLSPSELDRVTIDAMKLATGNANPASFRNAFLAEALPRMIVALTPPVSDLFADGVTWREPELQDLLWETGAWKKHFTAKDTELLSRIFSARHELAKVDREAALARMNGTSELWLRGKLDDADPDRSGKLVEYAILDVDVIREARELAGKDVDADASYLEYRSAFLRRVLPQMIVAVSQPVKLAPYQGAKLPPPEGWMKGPFAWGRNWDSHFSAQETALIQSLFTELHEVSDAEVEILSGKEIPVSSEG